MTHAIYIMHENENENARLHRDSNLSSESDGGPLSNHIIALLI